MTMNATPSLGDPDLENTLEKRDDLEKIDLTMRATRSIQAVFKAGERFVIWGPASVEVVDKEDDRITAEALDKALPQLLERARLSLEHSDQIVGRILRRFSTEKPVTVKFNGQEFERSDFPTEVLDLDGMKAPALFVAGEVYDDTEQAQRTRERIENGELTSYSISGEALVTQTKVDGTQVHDEILELDLSAVTLCEEGMNQFANYDKVEGEVADVELAGEATDEVGKREVTLQDPVAETVSAGSQEAQAVSKEMTDNENEEEDPEDEKSEGPGIEDVLKRLPDEGEIATKDDLDSVRKEAVSAVEDTLPKGDLATVDAVESMVDQKVDSRVEQIKGDNGPEDADVDAPEHDGDYGADSGGKSPADSTQAEAGDVDQGGDSPPSPDSTEQTAGDGQGPNQGQETGDNSGVESTSSKSDEPDFLKGEITLQAARDKIANELGVETKEVNDALTTFLSSSLKGDDEEEFDDEDDDDEVDVVVEEDEEEEEDLEDVVEDEDDDEEDEEEVDVVTDQDDTPDLPEDDEEDGDEEGDGEFDDEIVQQLKDDLPEDVWEVVREYVGDSKRAKSDSDDPEEEEIVAKAREIIEGGAKAQGGTAIPTGPDEDEADVEKAGIGAVSDDEDGEGDLTSPALSNFDHHQ